MSSERPGAVWIGAAGELDSDRFADKAAFEKDDASSPHDEERDRMLYASRWIAVARASETLAPLVVDREWRILEADTTVRVWTDDFSDVFGVLRR